MNKDVQVTEVTITDYFPGMTDSFLAECLSTMNVEYTWIANNTGSIEQRKLIEKAKWKFGCDFSTICVLRLLRKDWTDWYITLQQNTQAMIDTIGRLNKLRAFL